MMSSNSLPGTEATIRALENLPAKMQDGAIRAGLTAAAKVIRTEARLRAPRKTGQLAKAIVSGSSRKNQDNTFSIRVYVDERKPHGFLGYFYEYGVRPHLIASTGRGEGRVAVRKAKSGTGTIKKGVMKIGDGFVSGIISHPGHGAHPFMRPALDTKADEAIEAFTVRIREYIEKIGTQTGYNAFADAD